MSIIQVKDVNKIYRTNEVETLALENVNISIEKGEFVSIMGPSGCGVSWAPRAAANQPCSTS